MIKAGFVGFGEVNTPKEIIVKKCAAAHDLLHTQGIDTVSVYPVTDDYEERDIAHALDVLGSEDFDCLVLCVAAVGTVRLGRGRQTRHYRRSGGHERAARKHGIARLYLQLYL